MITADQAPYGFTGDDQPFWDGAAHSHLFFQQCDDCRYIRWPAAGVCPECLSRRTTWTEVDGEGVLWSHVVYHRAYAAALRDEIPYRVGLVLLDCGVRLLTRLVDVESEEIEIGMRLRALFRQVGDHGVVPVFGPTP